jgi:hypothetical protein
MLHLTTYAPVLTLKNDAIMKHMQAAFDSQKVSQAPL